jgi:hypothetical protein
VFFGIVYDSVYDESYDQDRRWSNSSLRAAIATKQKPAGLLPDLRAGGAPCYCVIARA